jgi:sulfoxide reductase heme-binding subunit YedZ
MNRQLMRWARVGVHPLALLPLALLAFDAATGRLSVNPIQDLTLRTGYAALVLLMLCLACTPAVSLFGWKWAGALRKPLGLYSFLYVCLHLLVFVALDYGLDAGLIWQAVAEKRYVLAGFAAFLLLLPLALTSTRGALRRLGRWWRRIHWLIYPAAILAVLHYLWLSKLPREPLIFAAVLAALLALRLPPISRRLRGRRGAPLPAAEASRTPQR